MPSKAFTNALTTPIPQSQPADPRQVPNNAGGFVFEVDDKARLERFLILGTDGGTYYVSEQKLTNENIAFVKEMIERNFDLVADTVREVSEAGRAYRNSPALLVAALLLTSGRSHAKARNTALAVARTATHLFELCEYIELLKPNAGWGPSKRKLVSEWYLTKRVDQVAYQAVKYRQRNGWTHRDLLRLAHVKGLDPVVGNFILGKPGLVVDERPDLDILRAFFGAQEKTDVRDLLSLMDEPYAKTLPWEALPTQFLKNPEVWKKLFYNGQMAGQALVRNVTRLARIGAFNDMVFARDYATKLADEEMISRTRLHPINFLNALVVHNEGQVKRDSAAYGFGYPRRVKDWLTVPVISEALNSGFYSAFKNVQPAGKRTLIGLDVSGSMSGVALGLDLSCATVTAAMSMFTARTEPYYQVMGFADQFRDLGISPSDSLENTVRKVQKQNFGSTNCSLPMIWARQNRVEVDTFLVMTDNETWAGNSHPHIELRNYRNNMGIDAKLVVAGVASTNFTIADPSDRGMMDVVGFDSNAPKVVADFSAGRI